MLDGGSHGLRLRPVRAARIRALEEENEQLRVLLDSAVRAFRAVDGDLAVAREQLVVATGGTAETRLSAVGSDVDGVRVEVFTGRSQLLHRGSAAAG